MSEGHNSPTVEQMNQSTEVFNYYSCLNGILWTVQILKVDPPKKKLPQ